MKTRINPWFDSSFLTIIKERNNLKKSAIQSHNTDDWNLYKSARNRFTSAIAAAKRKYYHSEFAKSLLSIPFWNAMDKITGYRSNKKSAVQIFSLRDNDGTEFSDPASMDTLLAASFSPISSLEVDPSISDDVNKFCDQASLTPIPSHLHISPSEVISAIDRVKMGGASSPTLIPAKVIKFLKSSLAPILALLFTQIFSLCHVPDSFKSTIVRPLYKGKGAKKSADSFRPINLLQPLSKFFELILLQKLTPLIEPHLCSEQHGFRKFRSCETAVTLFTQSLFEKIDQKNGKVGVVFIDFKKAFNHVNHTLLLKKLMSKFSLCPILLNVVRSFLKNRSFRILNNGLISRSFPEIGGVPQGSSLAPLLFAAFINDIALVIAIPFLLYADDLAIMVAGTCPMKIVTELNLCLVQISSWCESNGLQINLAKTEFMLFHKQHDKFNGHVPPVKLGNSTVCRCYKFKYLGLILDASLTFRHHFKHVDNKLSSTIGKLHSIKRLLPEKAMIRLVKCYIVSSYDFCNSIWAVQSHLELMTLQSKIDRLVFSILHPSLFKKFTNRMMRPKKSSRKLLYNQKDALFINSSLVKCNMPTVPERAAWARLKNVTSFMTSPIPNLNSFYSVSTNARSSRSFPLLSIDSFSSTTFKNSVRFKTCKIWNDLPKNWKLDFSLNWREIFFDHLVSLRKSIWLKY